MTVDEAYIPLQVDEDIVLNNISPYFKVSKTKYGGRGCFTYHDIPKDTVILRCQRPISHSVTKPFKKECCNYCFNYFNGKILKSKISKKYGKDTCSIFFCSEECKESFISQDVNDIYQTSLLLIEKHYLNSLGKFDLELKEPPKNQDLDQIIVQEWNHVEEWEDKLNAMKPAKRSNQIPQINDSEYLEIKYVVGVLFQRFKLSTLTTTPNKYLEDIQSDELMKRELELFEILQSSETEKVEKFPYLLYSYINIYKFIKVTSLPELQPFINPQRVRDTIGRNLTNAFGIWSEVLNPTEDKEFLGFGVYPSASYFNHSCSPNLIKKRINNTLTFTTKRDIQANEELCIDYGSYLDENVIVRRKELSEWFFECGCEKCNIDLEKLCI
ncbi:uncharacterized protein RJT21DRAFT_20907 [Scheffersomyces amazonensis]|uniref:uncharacterized protein n=1 Tax=Scheffersomyces amazonensis TaxID=1078765 RepID=UPI00315C90E3